MKTIGSKVSSKLRFNHLKNYRDVAVQSVLDPRFHPQPAFIKQENVATSSDASAKCMPIHTSRSGVYRFGFLAVWIITSVAMVLDRFFWNIWARQTICSDGCGNDFFCEMDEVREKKC